MDIGELATVGARITEIGLELKAKRSEAQQIQAEISTLEKELAPLVSKHAQIIAEIVGQPVAPVYTPAPAPVVGTPRQPGGPFVPAGQGPDLNDIRRRIMAFIESHAENEPDGKPPGSLEISQALGIDVMLVRQAMMPGGRR